MKKDEEPIQVAIQAIATLMIWLKFLQDLRSHFLSDQNDYAGDLRHQTLLDGFTPHHHCVWRFFQDPVQRKSHNVDDGFFGSFFCFCRMRLGDFNTEFGTVQVSLGWFMFFLCSMFNMIIMLNLLISIIGESYGKISENLKAAAYQEKAGMIAENSFLIPQYRKDAFCDTNKYLVVTRDVSGEVEKDDDEIAEALENFRKHIVGKIEHSQKRIEKFVKLSEERIMKKLEITNGGEQESLRQTGISR